jgi:hypothetical protein
LSRELEDEEVDEEFDLDLFLVSFFPFPSDFAPPFFFDPIVKPISTRSRFRMTSKRSPLYQMELYPFVVRTVGFMECIM